MSVQLVLKNSSVQDKEATASQLAVGELALNYHSSGPFLQCEDSAGNIWRLGGVVIASTAPSSPSKGAWWLDSDDNSLFFYDGSSWISIQTGETAPGDITEGTARQLLQTNAVGNGTEWTSDIDVPGTLDVTGVATFDNNVVITGNLTVNGTTTTIDTTTLVVEDKNIELGVVGTPTDTTADGGGLTLKGATDKTLNWVNSTDSWTSSENVDLASGKTYKINGTDVLSATALGSAVQISSANIPSGTIVNDDVNASAAIAQSKLNLSITNAEVNASAAIAQSKLALDITNAEVNASAAIAQSKLDLSITNAEVDASAAIAQSKLDLSITNAEVNASAAIAGSKIQAASTSNAGAVQLTDSVSSTSTTTAATPNSVKTVNDLAAAALPKSGGTVTGALEIGTAGSLVFEGATADGFETTLAVTDPTADRTATLPDATTTLAGLAVAQTYTKAQRGSITTLTSATTVTPDFAASNNFTLTLGHNITLANPSNLTAGQSGAIFLVQDGTGSRTASFGSYWDFPSGSAPTLTTTASSVDLLVYVVRSTTSIHAQLLSNFS